jgi:UDP-N-acetylmuramoyl-tripeptide--D-alanyl-D-alanine ligase
VLGAVHLAHGDIEKAMAGLATMQAEKGRGRRYRLAKDGGWFTLIDESYNANPTSMRAAIALLRDAEPHGQGRRIAVLGDMLEMGEHSPAVHAGLAEPLAEAGIATVWLGGPDMAALRGALAEPIETTYRETADELAAHALESVRPGDVLVVKSSKGTGFSRIVAALLDKYQAFPEREDRS